MTCKIGQAALFPATGFLTAFTAPYVLVGGRATLDCEPCSANLTLQGVLLNLMIGLAPGSRLDQWGHVGGLVSGIVLEFLLGRRLQRNGLLGITEEPPLIPVFGKAKKQALT